MNILDILILAILAFSLFAGMYKGFLSSLLATAGLVGAWFGAQSVYQRVADIALSNRSLMAALTNYLEPETFFASGANTAVSSLGGNSAQIRQVADDLMNHISESEFVQKVLEPLRSAFENNMIAQSFQGINLNTVSEYFGQTLWEGIFHVLAFVLSFVVIYCLILLVVNLLDHVFNFPVLKAADWLVGGLFGLLRGAACVIILLAIGLPLLGLVAPDFAVTLTADSKLYALVDQIDFMHIGTAISNLICA